MMELSSQHPKNVHVWLLEDLTAQLLEDGFRPPWTRGRADLSHAEFLIRPAAWDQDGKHETPLNHLRFYIPYFRFLQQQERVLFLDDDVIIQKSVAEAFTHPMAEGAALVASCVAISYNSECDNFVMCFNELSYAQTGNRGSGRSAWAAP